MKALLLTLFILWGFSITAIADVWPYDPICRKFNATSETVTLSQPREQIVVLCKLGSSSYIEKNTLDRSAFGGWDTWAVQEYKKNQPQPFGESCTRFGAWIYRAVDSKGHPYQLCLFGDNSIIEERTFGNGPKSGWNEELDWALRIH